MASIVIIGAGPAGLVAAKTFLRSGLHNSFKITILEKSGKIGGLWAIDTQNNTAALDYRMPTNLSRFTVSFSDLSWQSVDLSSGLDGAEAQTSSPGYIPIFPKAWQVERYLQAYADRYIPNELIHLNSTVISAKSIQHEGRSKWRVEWQSSSNHDEACPPYMNGNSSLTNGVFDYMVVGSGFFSAPRHLDLRDNSVAKLSGCPKIIHTSELRSLSDILPADFEAAKKVQGNILVVGGGMSGAEAAEALALQISTSEYAPGSGSTKRSHLNVIHIAPKPFYALPPMIPASLVQIDSRQRSRSSREQHTFIPIDLGLYDLSRRPAGSITPSSGSMPPEKAQSAHKYITSIIGSDQSDLNSSALVSPSTKTPAFVALSEGYAEFVRSGHITTMNGRLLQIVPEFIDELGRHHVAASAIISHGEKTQVLDNVIGVVNAIGYSSLAAISFLDPDIKIALGFDNNCSRLPLLLEDHHTSHGAFPNLGFVGFYEGPYWGVMEMQARYLLRKWSSDMMSAQSVGKFAKTTNLDDLDDMRLAILRKDNAVPQFWMGDYTGIMEQIADDLNIKRNDDIWNGGRAGPVLAARYLDEGADKEEAHRTLKDLERTLLESSTKARFVARAAFRSLHGSWKMKRELNSFISSYPSGILTGTAKFHPREPTNENFDAEFLYIEEGELITKQGYTMNASRRYVYRYREAVDKISVWFVKEDGLTVDYLYHELSFNTRDLSSHPEGWLANADHLCIEDMYTTQYEFHFRGIALEKYGVDHLVKGPKKDYVSSTWYER